MESPFNNDPFCFAWQAFKNLYPDKTCVCGYGERPACIEHDGPCARTDFASSDNGITRITLYRNCPLEYQIDCFLLELARVSVGHMKRYGQRLDDAHSAILKEYDRLLVESQSAKSSLPELEGTKGKECGGTQSEQGKQEAASAA